MIDVKNRKCEELNCIKTPSFGNPGDKRPQFCKDHSS